MTDFSNLKVNLVLKKSPIDEYQKGIDFFFDELVKLNTNIFIIKKILEFPFDIFSSPGENIFFSTVVWNFYENSVLTITKLATDKKGDVYTLPRFKNWVLEQVKAKYALDFQNWLRKTRFNAKTERMLKLARNLRNDMIAHFNKHISLKMRKVNYINIKELEELKDNFNLVLDTISFDAGHEMLPLPYSENIIRPKGIDHRSDLEVILDSIAKNSVILNMPELQPEIWKYTKENYNEEGKKIINKYGSSPI